jgi:threonine dehydratase
VGVKVSAEIGARDALLAELLGEDYPVLDITDNEIAKYHIRHMVGGHAPVVVSNERVYRFEFPERPGALLNFLRKLGKKFNISLFHYRNHGAAFGRVLVGLQVSDDKRDQLHGYLEELGYGYWDETENMAYQLFLR